MKVYRCCREDEYQAYLRGEKYLPFIKTLYEGLKLQSLPLAPKDCELFRGSNISKGEIQKIYSIL